MVKFCELLRTMFGERRHGVCPTQQTTTFSKAEDFQLARSEKVENNACRMHATPILTKLGANKPTAMEHTASKKLSSKACLRRLQN